MKVSQLYSQQAKNFYSEVVSKESFDGWTLTEKKKNLTGELSDLIFFWVEKVTFLQQIFFYIEPTKMLKLIYSTRVLSEKAISESCDREDTMALALRSSCDARTE
jgi:hypothetical protein